MVLLENCFRCCRRFYKLEMLRCSSPGLMHCRDGSCHPCPEEGRWIHLRVPHEAQEGQARPKSRGLLRAARIHQGKKNVIIIDKCELLCI